MKKLVALIVVLVLTTATAAFASGGGSVTPAYTGNAAVSGAVQKSGSLPFTGLSLVGIVVAGVLLVAVGFLMRRARTSS